MSIRELERESIREFLERNDNLLTGRVLDFGCGKQPYRDIVEHAGGEYVPFDRAKYAGAVAPEDIGHLEFGNFSAVICTQVIQYASWPIELLWEIKQQLIPRGWLLMTGPTNWPVVELEDKWRFTVPAVDHMFASAGFFEIESAYRAQVEHHGEAWPLGWWAKGRVA